MVRMSDIVRGIVREKAADEVKGSAAPEAPPAPPRTRPVAEVPAPPPRVETPPAVEPAASLDALPLEVTVPETLAESAEPLFAELQLFLARVREIIRTGDAFPWSELEHLIERCVVSLERSSELFWVANNTIALAGVDYLAFHQARVAALAIAIAASVGYDRPRRVQLGMAGCLIDVGLWQLPEGLSRRLDALHQIGRASCRERV